jgi:hypothetical protein
MIGNDLRSRWAQAQAPVTQRIFERLREEHGFTGGITIVTETNEAAVESGAAQSEQQ